MTSPTPITNGSTSPKRQIAPKPETYHGIPVLALRVGEPIPKPPTPTWYVVMANPDLARYLLSFNHEHNRALRERSVDRFATDMREGHWRLTAQAVQFSRTGVLLDGQHRLMAVTEYGATVPLVISFGWPDDVVYVIDRGAVRTNADALRIDEVPNATVASAAAAIVWRYAKTVGTRRSWNGYPMPTAESIRAQVTSTPELWAKASRQGRRAYDRLDKGWTAAVWSAAYVVLLAHADESVVDAFFDEVVEGTGTPRSATRTLGDWARRRPVGDTRSRDSREPFELILRAFNAWRAGKTMSMVMQPAFELSRVKP